MLITTNLISHLLLQGRILWWVGNLVVCRMKLTPMNISNTIDVAEKLVSSICASFDRDETSLCCTDSARVQVSSQITACENNVKDSAGNTALVIHRSIEILTEYLRLLRNACANCLCNQSVLHTWVKLLLFCIRSLSNVSLSDHVMSKQTTCVS